MKSKIGSMILSVLIAFGLWMYVITVENPEQENTYSNLPVTISGEGFLTDRGLMITGGTNSTATLRVSGSRSDLKKLNASDIALIADVSNISTAGTHQVTYTVRYPGDIASGALQTQSRLPDSITLTVEKKVTKMMEIEIVYTGSLTDDYWADKENAKLVDKDDAAQIISSITVSGPESILEQITRAIITVDLTGRTQSFREIYRPTLCNDAGEPVELNGMVEANVGETALELVIQRFKEVELRLNIVDGGGATKQTSSIEIQPMTIRVSGNETVLESLEYIELGTLKLGELESDTQLAYDIYLPDGVTNLSSVTEAVVTVSFPTLQTREFRVDNIEAVNVPEGMEVDFLTQSLTVTLRGPAATIQVMSAEDVTITVDFSGVEAGTATMKAVIEIPPRYSSVGEIGSYSVSATLREISAVSEAG